MNLANFAKEVTPKLRPNKKVSFDEVSNATYQIHLRTVIVHFFHFSSFEKFHIFVMHPICIWNFKSFHDFFIFLF